MPRSTIVRAALAALLALSVAACDGIATPSDGTAGELGPVCQGDLVLDAPFYDPTEPGPHPLVLLDERGGPHAWTDAMPADWAPINPSEAELVACAGEQQLIALQPCTVDGVSVERSRALVPVDVRQAATGLLEQSFTLADEPPGCDALPAGDLVRVEGAVDATELVAALTAFVYPGTALRPGETPTPAPTPAPTPRRLELSVALKAGEISIEVRGDGLELLELTISSEVDEELEIVVRPATRFAPAAAGTQTMVVIEEATFVLEPKLEIDVELEVACAEMNDATPTADDSFGLMTKPPPEDLVRLLTLPSFAAETFRVKQFAIWTITDNPSRSRFVGLRSPDASGGPTNAEIGRIRALFKEAGILLDRYRATA